jgi:hypothetical protein
LLGKGWKYLVYLNCNQKLHSSQKILLASDIVKWLLEYSNNTL